ncbi:MAG: anhydro-N-acetylmuramic acid kinase [Chitinophagaceae bacterium]
MVYRAIGIMSGSSLDGLDVAFVEFSEMAGKWSYEIRVTECLKYDETWMNKLRGATLLNALDYQLLHVEYGHYIGERINEFVDKYGLHYQVQLIASHGHTSFHLPEKKMTAQLGDGAAIAAVTGINVVSDLRAIDVAFGGQGAPIVPIGEKLLLGDYAFFLNLGGIANISYNHPSRYVAFDVCPANRVLNMLAAETGKPYDDGGRMAAMGRVSQMLLRNLNGFDYYQQDYPKSLANNFGTDVIFPAISAIGLSVPDALSTYTEHIAEQVAAAAEKLTADFDSKIAEPKLLVTGGGAHNVVLVERIKDKLQPLGVEVVVPDAQLADFKEALIMALIGVLRWREENNVLASVTGAVRDSIGGAVWIGQEA